MILAVWQPPKLTGRSSGFMGGAVVLLIITVMLVSALLEANKPPASNLIPGDPLPDYTAISADGSAVSVGEFKGSVVLLSFWATWCAECVDQLPRLQQLKDEYADGGLVLVSVSLDDQDPAWVQEYLDAGGHDWLSLTDEPDHMDEVFGWGRRIPKTILVNRDGTVGVWWEGKLNPGVAENRTLIEEAISGKAVWSPGI
jgi:thiol-disulfide isomerase/thioredoxin